MIKHIWTITNITSGQELGGYEADDEDDALEAMAKDAGYESFAASCSVIGKTERECRRELKVELQSAVI